MPAPRDGNNRPNNGNGNGNNSTDKRVNIRFTADTSDAQSKVSKLQSTMDSLPNQFNINLGINDTQFRRDLSNLERYSDVKNMNINISADVSEAKRNIEDLKKSAPGNKKITFSADTQNALKDIQELTRQADTLASLLNQGTNRQGGILSNRQVDMYRNILTEVEASYSRHYDTLERMQNAHNEKVANAQGEVTRRQNLLNRAEGGNKWGDVSSQAIRDYHARKLDEAQKNYDNVSSNTRDISGMQSAVQQLGEQRDRVQKYSQNIDNLHTDPNNIRYGMSTLSQMAGILPLSRAISFANQGKNEVRDSEQLATILGQRVGGYQGNDSQLRTNAIDVGLNYGYTSQQTLQLQQLLSSGGRSTSNYSLLNQDTLSAQQFGRAYGQDPSQIAYTAAGLQSMGAMSDGDMRKFSELIAGSISRTPSLRGREGELTNDTLQLASQVGRYLPTVTSQNVASLVGLQTQIGQAVPSLAGSRGANIVANMNAGLQSGSNNIDLLLGKGTKYTGPQGMWDLRLREEQGVSNPNNLRDLVQGVMKNISGTNREVYQKSALSSTLNLSANQVETLWNAGVFQQMANGKTYSESQLKKMGSQALQDQTDQYNKTHASRVSRNQAGNAQTRQDAGLPLERIGGAINTLWNDVPAPLRAAGVFAGGALSGPILRKLATNLAPTVGGEGGMLGRIFGGAGSLFRGQGSTGAGGALGSGGGLLSRAGLTRFLGPLATLGAAKAGSDIGNSVGDWFFGHRQGQMKMSLFSNPLNPQYYTDNKEGALDQLWNKITGKDNKSKNDSSSQKSDTKDSKRSDNTTKGEKIIRVVVSGNVDGMTSKNRDTVADGMKSAFQAVLDPFGLSLDLSKDTTRG